MTRIRSKQSGFSIVQAVVIVAIIGLLGAAGWLVYQHNRTKVTDAAPNSNQQTTNTTPPAPTVTYLAIKEWGLKLPLSDTIKDVYYVVPTGISKNADGQPSGIILGLTSLTSACGTVSPASADYSHSLGEIVRALPTEKDPVTGKLYTELLPNGITIGNYYYGYSSNITNKTCAPQTMLQSIDAAFINATKQTAAATTN